MKVSFVIPIWNNFGLINQLLADIRDHCTPDEIVVVDDCSSDLSTLDGLNWWAHNYGVKIIRPINNLGFLKAANYGVSKATGDIICLISSDVRLEDNLALLAKNIIFGNSKTLVGGIMYEHDTGWNTFNGRTFSYLEGWLLCCLKLAWQDLGGFDELYCPNDYEDIDISTTAIEKGYTLVPLNNPMIRHIGGQTIGYTDERMALTLANKEKFRAKWMKA